MAKLDRSTLVKEYQDFYNKGKYDKAVASLELLKKIESTNAWVFIKLGDTYSKLSRTETAVENYKKAAEIYNSSGFTVQAIAVYKMIVKISPENQEVKKILSDIELSRKTYASQVYVKEETSPTQREVSKGDEARLRVGKIPLFDDLTEEEFNEVVNKTRLLKFKAGDFVCMEGDDGDSLYFLTDGEIDVLKITEDSETVVYKFHDSGFFGEYGFFTGAKRGAALKAVKETTLLELTAQDLKETINIFPGVGDILLKIYKERVLDTFIAVYPLFKDIPADVRAWLAESFERQFYPKNFTVVEEGEEGDSFFIVKKGRASAKTRDIHDNQVLLKILIEGDFFGEVSLITGKPRTATVYADEDLELMVLKKDKFQELIEKCPFVKNRLEEVITQRAEDAVKKIVYGGRCNI